MQTEYLGTTLWELLSGPKNAAPSYGGVQPTAGSQDSLFTKEISGNSIQADTPDGWTAFQADSLAKILAQLEKDRVLKENDLGYGANTREYWSEYDPNSHSLKIRQCLLFEDSTESYAILPRSGTMRNGKLYRRPPLVLHTKESASGFLPTPLAADGDYPSHLRKTWRQSKVLDAKGPEDRVKLCDWWTAYMQQGLHPYAPGNSANPLARKKQPMFREWAMGWPMRYTE